LTRDDVVHAVIETIREETENMSAKISDQTVAGDIPGWDSLAQVRIIYALEAKFDLELDIDEANQAANVGELIALISKFREC
jgi:acyl carrier protein